MPAAPSSLPVDPIDALLSAHGLRRTGAARRVLGWLLAHPDTSYTHAQLQSALPLSPCPSASGSCCSALDRVTLYRLIDRLTQVGLLL
jgi:Fur family ferric uptake transcriptional regulator